MTTSSAVLRPLPDASVSAIGSGDPEFVADLLTLLEGRREPAPATHAHMIATKVRIHLRWAVVGLSGEGLQPEHLELAEQAIRRVDGKDDDAPLDVAAVRILAEELHESLREFFVRWIAGPAPSGTLDEIRDGALGLDLLGADHVERYGDQGRLEAELMRERSRECVRRLQGKQLLLIAPGGDAMLDVAGSAEYARNKHTSLWWFWTRPAGATAPRFVRLLAGVLYVDRVRPALLEARYPTYPLRFVEAATRAFMTRGREAPRDERGLVIRGRDGAVVAEVNLGAAVATVPALLLTRRGPKITSSLTAQRVFRDLPHRAREQMIRDMLDPARAAPRICIEGGLSAYCRELGIDEGRTQDLADVLDLFQGLHAIGTDGTYYHGLLMWEQKKATKRRGARVLITPSPALFTGSRGKLIPIPHRMPRFVGSPNESAAQAALQLLVILELRDRALELLERGGVLITRERWAQLAAEPGVSASRLEALLASAWVEDGDGEPAFLARVEANRWSLGPRYTRELEVLLEGARYDAAGKRGGKAAAQRRARLAGVDVGTTNPGQEEEGGGKSQ